MSASSLSLAPINSFLARCHLHRRSAAATSPQAFRRPPRMAKRERCWCGSTAAGGSTRRSSTPLETALAASGMTLLMIAMASGHAELAEALLRRGADVSLQKSDGGTALSLAALNGREKLVELALRHGAEVNQKKNERRHCADGRRLQRPRAGCRHADPARRRDQPADQQRRHRSDGSPPSATIPPWCSACCGRAQT